MSASVELSLINVCTSEKKTDDCRIFLNTGSNKCVMKTWTDDRKFTTKLLTLDNMLYPSRHTHVEQHLPNVPTITFLF